MSRQLPEMRTCVILSAAVFVLASWCVAHIADADSEPVGPHVQIVMTEEGPVFATASGMTLYTYSGDDGTPGKSQCLNVPRTEFPDPTAGFGHYPLPSAQLHKSCVQKWPPLFADEHAKLGGDWGVIERTEGGKQWTYRNRPLYTSIKDHKPGDINGSLSIGQMRGWRLASAPLNLPPGLKLTRRPEGLVLATTNDRPIFTPQGVQAKQTCDRCDERFKPVTAPALSTVSGDWSIVSAGPGRAQYSFKGKPLYVAPDSLSNSEIVDGGGWQTVVFRASAGIPKEIQSRFSLLGDVYSDNMGKTLYVFTCTTPVGDGVRCDDPGDAAAYWSALCGEAKDCARRWRPYAADATSREQGDWSIIEVSDPMFTEATGATYPADTNRVKAWAYRGRPVYTYYEDKGPGEIWGHSRRWFGFSGFYALQVPGRGLQD